jgi:hypothetical protein
MENEPKNDDKDLSPEEMEKIAGGALEGGSETQATPTIKIAGALDARRMRNSSGQ